MSYFLISPAHFIVQASPDTAAPTCNNNAAARILYLRQPQWTDWTQLLTAVEATHPITAMHIIDTNTCRKSKLCSTGSLAVLGDASGAVTVISPSIGIIFETSNIKRNVEVTALTSFPSESSSIVIVVGYSDGTLLWHSLSGEEGKEEEKQKLGGHGEKKEIEFSSSSSSKSGSIPSETSSPWTVLDAFALHGGKHGFVNLAGATGDGQIAWGRIFVGTRKKYKLNSNNELHWDSLLVSSSTGGNLESNTANTTNTTTTGDESNKINNNNNKNEVSNGGAVVAVKAHLKAAEYITYTGELIWSPFLVKNRKQHRHVLRPPRPCEGWEKHNTNNLVPTQMDSSTAVLGLAVSDSDTNNIREDTIPQLFEHFSAVAIESPSSPTSRIFLARGSSELASYRTGTASGRPSCHVITRKTVSSTKFNNLNSTHGIKTMAVLPGYVVAVSSTGYLGVYNTSGSFHRPSFEIVLQQAVQDLTAEVHEKINLKTTGSTMKRSTNTLWQSMASVWKKDKILEMNSGNFEEKKYRIAAGASIPFPVASFSSSHPTALVAIQLHPTLVGLYATSFPYTPPRGVSGGLGSKNRINWIAALQPLLVVIAVGFAMHKAKVGKRQAAAQKFFRSRMMDRAAAGGAAGGFNAGGGFRGTTLGRADDEDDWDAPFPWEQRMNSRSNATAASGSGSGEQTRREHRNKFKIDTGLGGSRRKRATTTSAGDGSTAGRSNRRSGGGGTSSSTLYHHEEESYRYHLERPPVPPSLLPVPPPLIDRAPLPGDVQGDSNGGGQVVLDSIGSGNSSSSGGYTDKEEIEAGDIS